MARTPVNLGSTDLDRFRLLYYGEPGAGKTRFLGDALQWHLDQGLSCKFINCVGEDGYRSMSGYDIPEGVAETISELSDLKAICEEGPYDFLAIDSLSIISKWSMEFVTRGTRIPVMNKETNEWSQIHLLFENGVRNRVLPAAKVLICSAHAQRYENQVTGEMRISPNLEGKQSTMVVGWFDMVAYAQATTLGTGEVQRKFIVKPMARGTKEEPGYVTRQRLPRQITEDILLPEGDGAWTKVMDVIKAHL